LYGLPSRRAARCRGSLGGGEEARLRNLVGIRRPGPDRRGVQSVGDLRGVEITRFVFPLGGAVDLVIEDAVATVAQHHPNEVIWVQRASTRHDGCALQK